MKQKLLVRFRSGRCMQAVLRQPKNKTNIDASGCKIKLGARPSEDLALFRVWSSATDFCSSTLPLPSPSPTPSASMNVGRCIDSYYISHTPFVPLYLPPRASFVLPIRLSSHRVPAGRVLPHSSRLFPPLPMVLQISYESSSDLSAT